MEPVYILIRSSGRPEFFKRMMETIKSQTYKNIVTIIHCDDPRDRYIEGDIIINGSAYGPEYGSAPYNLYNNRLLKMIPNKSGWYHFIDDDDEYASNDVIEKLVQNSKRNYVNVGHVMRWNETIWPKDWGSQLSYQTECFFLHTDHKLKARWWGNKGGDHHYSKQLTKILPINWIDKLLICRAQEGKGHGRKLDKGGNVVVRDSSFNTCDKVTVLGLRKYLQGKRNNWIRQGKFSRLNYDVALELEKNGIVKITHWQTYREKKPIKNIYNL